MRVLVATVPATGHVLPLVSLAQELSGRGHEVIWATGLDQCEQLDQLRIAARPVCQMNRRPSDRWRPVRIVSNPLSQSRPAHPLTWTGITSIGWGPRSLNRGAMRPSRSTRQSRRCSLPARRAHAWRCALRARCQPDGNDDL